METQPSDVISWGECLKWMQFLLEDEPHGELRPNGGDSGLMNQSRDVQKAIPEFESMCMAMIIAIIIADEVLTTPGYTVT